MDIEPKSNFHTVIDRVIWGVGCAPCLNITVSEKVKEVIAYFRSKFEDHILRRLEMEELPDTGEGFGVEIALSGELPDSHFFEPQIYFKGKTIDIYKVVELVHNELPKEMAFLQITKRT